jgi:hypothetical protein
MRYLNIFLKSVEIIPVRLKSDRNNGYLETQHSFMIISRTILLIMRNVSDKSVGKIKTHFMSRNFFCFCRKCAAYENVEKCRNGQATDDNMAHCMLDT